MPSATASPAPARPKTWLVAAGIVAVVLGVPAWLDQGKPLRHPFNERPLRAFEKARAEGVLLGDSMLETRIDPEVLKTVSGERWEVLAQPGSSSAMWFLMLKNLVAVQTPPPRTVIVFFRDRQLTLPAHRTEGGYRKTIESYMREREPVLDELLQSSARQQQPWAERLTLAMYPVQWRREAWRDKVQSWALDLVASSREYNQIRDDARATFELRHLRQDSGLDFEREEGGQRGLDPAEHDFAAAVGRSFLPHLLALARARQMHLVFFRVKRKPGAAGEPATESATTPAYMQELRAYVEKAGAQLMDETRDADVTRDFYGADDHLAPAMMKSYTELFWRKVGPQLPPVPAPAR